MRHRLLASLGFLTALINVDAMAATRATQVDALAKQVATLEHELAAMRTKLQALSVTPHQPAKRHHVADLTRTPPNRLHAQAVTTSSWLGLRSAFDGSNLVVNYPTLREDVRLLQQRSAFAKDRRQHGEAVVAPMLELSGSVAGAAKVVREYEGDRESDADLDTVELDAMVEANPWVTGLISINYDNNPSNIEGNLRVGQSRLYVKRGFITIGNLDVSPWYVTMGQFYMPFGRYASGLDSSTITKRLGRELGRGVVLGYHRVMGTRTLDLSGFAQRAESSKSGESERINQWGASADVKGVWGRAVWSGGVGWVSNLAASNHLVSVLALDDRTTSLSRNVGGFDVHTEWSLHPISVNLEYLTATSHFAEDDLSGTKPSAMHTEIGVSLPWSGKHAPTLSFGYDRSWDGAASWLPQRSVFAVLNAHWWANTLLTLELRKNRYNWDASDSGEENRALLKLTMFF